MIPKTLAGNIGTNWRFFPRHECAIISSPTKSECSVKGKQKQTRKDGGLFLK